MFKAGPYIVVSVLGDKYSIQDLLTHKVVDTHASNLSEFRYDPTSGLSPTEVAARNAGEFFIDKIFDHTGNVRRRSEMSFHVRWKGYTPDDDTWQPIKSVRETNTGFRGLLYREETIFPDIKEVQNLAWQSPRLPSSTTRAPLLRTASGTLESYVRFSP